jgi:hypothetical protein
MFNLSKKPKTGQATFVLLYVRQSNFVSAITKLPAPKIVDLIRTSTEICERIAEKTHAGIVRLQGDCIIAWNENDAPPGVVGYRNICEMLAHELRKASSNLMSKSAFEPKISLAITKGLCIFERKDREYVNLFGDPMNRVSRISERFHAEENIILVDEPMKMLWEDARLAPMGSGIFKVGPAERGQAL